MLPILRVQSLVLSLSRCALLSLERFTSAFHHADKCWYGYFRRLVLHVWRSSIIIHSLVWKIILKFIGNDISFLFGLAASFAVFSISLLLLLLLPFIKEVKLPSTYLRSTKNDGCRGLLNHNHSHYLSIHCATLHSAQLHIHTHGRESKKNNITMKLNQTHTHSAQQQWNKNPAARGPK